MMIWKRSIPRVAGATLVFGGFSCGGGGGGGGGGVTINEVANLACDGLRTCDPTEFAASYASFADCVDYAADVLQEYLDDYEAYYGHPTTGACYRAYGEYLECYYEAYRALCDEVPDPTCEALGQRADDACLFI